MSDTNHHLIAFYSAIQSGSITPRSAKAFLEKEGAALLANGDAHYYAIRERFNREADPLDFLFLNRSCFNGMVRFNRKGGFNVPFCRKPDRFRQAYVTKIVNQIDWIAQVIRMGDWKFFVSDWAPILAEAKPGDFAYLDPPYVGRHTDYHGAWDEQKADTLADTIKSLPCGFAYSMWARNKYRENEHLIKWFSNYPILLEKHFYHVGPTESLRNEVEEALVINQASAVANPEIVKYEKTLQLGLL